MPRALTQRQAEQLGLQHGENAWNLNWDIGDTIASMAEHEPRDKRLRALGVAGRRELITQHLLNGSSRFSWWTAEALEARLLKLLK